MINIRDTSPQSLKILNDTLNQLLNMAYDDNGKALRAGAITTPKIADNAITSPKIVYNAVQAPHIEDSAIIASKIAQEAVTGDEYDDLGNFVKAGKLAANTIYARNIAAEQILTNHLSAGAVTADKIGANAIIAGKIAANAIQGNEIAAGAITADKLSVNELTGLTIIGGSLNTATAGNNNITLSGNTIRFDSVIGGSGGTVGYIRGNSDIEVEMFPGYSFNILTDGFYYLGDDSATNLVTKNYLDNAGYYKYGSGMYASFLNVTGNVTCGNLLFNDGSLNVWSPNISEIQYNSGNNTLVITVGGVQHAVTVS